MEIAQLVAYHPSNRQKMRVVTVEGDIVDPSGTITGGYQSNTSQYLPKVRDMVRLRNQIRGEEARRDAIQERIKKNEEEVRFHT
jgi:chromosome segregation ATPase